VHSLAGEGRHQDWSGQRKKDGQRGALTYWIGKRLELVRTQKENEPVMGAHNLERAELGTGQDMKRKCGEAHLPTGRVDVKTGQDMEKRCASDRHSQSGGVRGQAGQD